jgi:hypothetical protein
MKNTSKKKKTDSIKEGKIRQSTENPLPKKATLERSLDTSFDVPFIEARIDMDHYQKLEDQLVSFKRSFDKPHMMFVDKLKRIDDDQMDSLFIYYTKIHPDIMLMKVDVDELPKGTQVGIIAVKRGHAMPNAK